MRGPPFLISADRVPHAKNGRGPGKRYFLFKLPLAWRVIPKPFCNRATQTRNPLKTATWYWNLRTCLENGNVSPQNGPTKTTDFVRICTFDKLECWAKAKNRQNWPPVLKSVMMVMVAAVRATATVFVASLAERPYRCTGRLN